MIKSNTYTNYRYSYYCYFRFYVNLKYLEIKSWRKNSQHVEKVGGTCPSREGISSTHQHAWLFVVCGDGAKVLRLVQQVLHWALLPAQLYRCLFYFNTKTAEPVRELHGERYWLCRPRNQHSMCRTHIKVAWTNDSTKLFSDVCTCSVIHMPSPPDTHIMHTHQCISLRLGRRFGD